MLLSDFEQHIVTVVYCSSLIPLALVIALSFTKRISKQNLVLYIAGFLICALGWEIWFTYGLVDGQTVDARRSVALNAALPQNINWLLNSLADAGWLGDSHTDQYLNTDFQKGVALLGKNGLSYDTWHYHTHNKKYAALARACPDTQFVFDHFGTPIGKGQYEGKRAEVFSQWKLDVAEIAKCGNVVAKLGGLAMPPNGFGWDERASPARSDEIVAAHREYYLHMIDCFGPDRCMLESNFPVDKMSMSYAVYWNAAKKLTADFSEDEKTKMFSGTASRIYKL